MKKANRIQERITYIGLLKNIQCAFVIFQKGKNIKMETIATITHKKP